MNENLQNLIHLSETLNEKQVDNIFEINMNNANIVTNSDIKHDDQDFYDTSLNITNMEISKLILLFKLKKSVFKDFFRFQLFEMRTVDEIIKIFSDCTNIIDFDIFNKTLNYSIRIKNLDLLNMIFENFKDFILENHIPLVFDLLIKFDIFLNLKTSDLETNSHNKISNPKIQLSIDNKSEDQITTKKIINIFKNLFEIKLDYPYLTKQYKLQNFSNEKLKNIVQFIAILINYFINHINNYHSENELNSSKINIYENISDHLKIFNLLNEVYFYKLNNNETDYTSMRREIKILTDIIKQVNTSLIKSENREFQKKEFDDIKKRLDAFKNLNGNSDVVYETIIL